MKRFIIGLIIAITVISGVSIEPAYAVKNEFFKQSNNIEFSSRNASGLTSGEFVYYSQNDPRWKDKLYGKNSEGATIGEAGCAPTSLAMIIATLVDPSAEPVQVAQIGFDNGSFIPGQGSAHGPLLGGAAKKWSFVQTTLTGSSIDEVMLFVKNGGYVYVSGIGPAPFTGAGHIVAIRDVDMSNGTITIADPYRGEADVYSKEVVDSYRATTIGITK